jgi:hypothetical protein
VDLLNGNDIMKTKALLAASLLANGLLLGAVAYLSKQDDNDLAVAPLVVCIPHPAPQAPGTPTGAVASAADPEKARAIGRIESEDYKRYIAHLRSVGCPDETIRRVLIADINDLFHWRAGAQVASANWIEP